MRCEDGLGSFSSFLDRGERYRLRRETTAREQAGVDLPATVYRPMPVGLDKPLNDTWAGTTAEVELTINARGEVDAISLLKPEDEQLEQTLGDSLRHWLFVPRVSGGKAVPTTQRFQVPL